MMYGLIQRTLAANETRNVTLHTCALSDKAGTFQLHLPGGSECEASLEASAAKNVNGRPGRDVLVQVRHAGDCLNALALPRVRLLKIDVEGHEGVILNAADPFLRRTPPDMIVFESHSSRGPFFERAEVRALASHGYDFLAVHRRLFFISLHAIRAEADLADAWYDFVAIAPTAGGADALSRLPR